MVLEGEAIVNITDIAGGTVFTEILGKISFLSTFIQALGGIILLYLIFSIISAIREKKRINLLKDIKNSLQRIEKKLKK